jgi:hypothetical protein
MNTLVDKEQHLFEDRPLTEKAKKQFDAIAAVVPVTYHEHAAPYFRHLTGEMLRKLVDAGTVVFRGPDESWDYDSDIFKGGRDEESLAFLEKYPRFFAQGYVLTSEDGARLSIDTIIGGVKTEENPNGGLRIATHKKPLTKQEIFAFTNLFHKADEFEIGSTYAHAWFD